MGWRSELEQRDEHSNLVQVTATVTCVSAPAAEDMLEAGEFTDLLGAVAHEDAYETRDGATLTMHVWCWVPRRECSDADDYQELYIDGPQQALSDALAPLNADPRVSALTVSVAA